MTHPIHVMVDTETWGTRPGCEIRSIGATLFEPDTGYVAGWDDHTSAGNFYIATENPRGYYDSRSRAVPHWYNDPRGWETKYDLHRDPDTEAWWAEQSDEAQGAFENPVDLADGLARFSAWLFNVAIDPTVEVKACRKCHCAYPAQHQICDYCGEPSEPVLCCLWSHGAATDAPWLAAAYHACGLPVPWHYRAPRDTRTLFDLAGIDDHSAWLKQHPGPLGIAHHSLDDAVCQARAVCAAWQTVSTWSTEWIRNNQHAPAPYDPSGGSEV